MIGAKGMAGGRQFARGCLIAIAVLCVLFLAGNFVSSGYRMANLHYDISMKKSNGDIEGVRRLEDDLREFAITNEIKIQATWVFLTVALAGLAVSSRP